MPVVLASLQAPRLGATLARLSDWGQRFGGDLDARQAVRREIEGVVPGATLDGPWRIDAVALDADGTILVGTLPGRGRWPGSRAASTAWSWRFARWGRVGSS
ncbi:MAG: hypothetical protein R3F60_31545 [bacterium]